MNTLQILYAESIPALANQSKEEFEQEARLALAYKLFEMGRLTSGQAAELGGVSRVQFLLEASRFNVASVIWDEEEMAAEFAHPEKDVTVQDD
jgi:predicted HTH domain antitoxin